LKVIAFHNQIIMGVDPNGSKSQQLISDPFDDNHFQLDQPPPPSPAAAFLPPGWTAAVTPGDGRLYYLETSTGRTSWTHPGGAPQKMKQPVVVDPSTMSNVVISPQQHQDVVKPSLTIDSGSPSGIMATRTMKSRLSFDSQVLSGSVRPRTHVTFAIVATILFFPLGLFAIVHSMKVNQAWDSGRYSKAVIHSRRVLLFSRLAITIGGIIWMYWFFFAGPESLIFDLRPMFEI
jgi:hypothetical protein